MYVIHHSTLGSYKAEKLSELKQFAEFVLMLDDTSWIHFRKDTVAVSPCEYHEAEKVDGRTVKHIDWATI